MTSIRAARAKTEVRISRQWAAYLTLLTKFQPNTVPLPSSPYLIRCFIQHLHDSGLANSTIRSMLCTIAHQHKAEGFLSPTNDYLLSQMFKGFKKTNRTKPDDHHPLTTLDLSRLISSATKLHLSYYNVALFRALFSTMFHAFLWASEVTKHAHNLPFSSCRLSHNRFKLIFSSSKSSGRPASISIKATGKRHCPLSLLQKYLTLRSTEPGPLFIFRDGHPINRTYFNKILSAAKKVAKLTGRITTHSFRIGAATNAAAMGFSTQQIKIMGRWKSDAYSSYVCVVHFESPNVSNPTCQHKSTLSAL